MHEIKLRAMYNIKEFSNSFLSYKREWLSIGLTFFTFIIGIRMDLITYIGFIILALFPILLQFELFGKVKSR